MLSIDMTNLMSITSYKGGYTTLIRRKTQEAPATEESGKTNNGKHLGWVNNKNAERLDSTDEPAATVEISDEARQKSEAAKESEPLFRLLTEEESIFEFERIELSQSEFNELVDIVIDDPDMARQLKMTTEDFQAQQRSILDEAEKEYLRTKNSDGIARTNMRNALNAYTDNEYNIARDLVEGLEGRVVGEKAATLTERVTLRETALLNAQSIADELITDSADKEAFLEAVQKLYKKETLREQGYKVDGIYKNDPIPGYLRRNTVSAGGEPAPMDLVIDYQYLFENSVGKGLSPMKDGKLNMEYYRGMSDFIAALSVGNKVGANPNQGAQQALIDAYEQRKEEVLNTTAQVKATLDPNAVHKSLLKLLESIEADEDK